MMSGSSFRFSEFDLVSSGSASPELSMSKLVGRALVSQSPGFISVPVAYELIDGGSIYSCGRGLVNAVNGKAIHTTETKRCIVIEIGSNLS